MEHAESLPIDLEAPPAPLEEAPDLEPPVVRRNSVNVASVYRSSCPEPMSRRHVDSMGLAHCSQPDSDSGVIRRNSLNVASFMRSKRDMQEVPTPSPFSPWSKLPRQSLNVDMSTIRQHIQFRQQTDDTGSETMTSQPPHDATAVQFTIPDDFDLTDDDDSTYHPRRPPKSVTFGAYYDTHNDQMIPELRQVGSSTKALEDLDLVRRLQKILTDAPPGVQIAGTNIACVLTYAIMRSHPDVHLQIMTMILVTLCGSTLPHLITAVACGVYAGSVSSDTLPSYPWVILLGFLTSIVWQVVSTFKVMLGFSGRLGASAFVGMNLTAVIAFAANPIVDYGRYGNLDELWDDLTWEEAIVTIASCVFLASSASFFRLIATVPVNPVLVPSTWALFCMLLASLADYQHNPSIYGGFAVGAYVAMAAESRLPSVKYFATVGLIAGLWIVLFKPFFLGFGGKSGFTAMVGYSSFLTVKTVVRKFAPKKHKATDDDGNKDNASMNSNVYSA